jgi:choline dehydrogenase-like flavoprotein
MPTRSLWLQEALAAEEGVESVELTEPVRADVCVVGGGYTGLWTALRIAELEPGASIALVEADICGGGPSGRNGGFALSWWPKVETLIKRTGEEEAFRLVRASATAVDELGAFCERESVDARFRRGGWLWTATSPAQVVGGRSCRCAPAILFEALPRRRCSADGAPVHLGARTRRTW